MAGAEVALADVAASSHGQRYPLVAPLWNRAWEHVTPALEYPLEIRRLLMTTNALDSLNCQLRQTIKTRRHFPSEEAATKLLYLALRNIEVQWGTAPTWRAALTHFAVLFGDRFTPEL